MFMAIRLRFIASALTEEQIGYSKLHARDIDERKT